MKYLITIIAIIIGTVSYAQISIGKLSPEVDAILDFGNANDRGIILPHILTLHPSSVAGTLYYDTSDSKVKALLEDPANAGSLIAQDLSVLDVAPAAQYDVTKYEYAHYNEKSQLQGVVIGNTNSTAPGVLVLESTEHAMILPKVTSYLNIGAPEPGTLIYDEIKNMICIFDGEKWAFWGK